MLNVKWGYHFKHRVFFCFCHRTHAGQKIKFSMNYSSKSLHDVNPSIDVVNGICNTLLIMRKMRKPDQQNIWLDVPWY